MYQKLFQTNIYEYKIWVADRQLLAPSFRNKCENKVDLFLTREYLSRNMERTGCKNSKPYGPLSSF